MNLSIGVLLGKIITRIDRKDDELVFTCSDGKKYKMYHSQSCCEYVRIIDICGDLEDLIDSPILMAEESTNDGDPPPDEFPDSCTWTFYKFATLKGYVTITWLGESNGYYSESVDFGEIS